MSPGVIADYGYVTILGFLFKMTDMFINRPYILSYSFTYWFIMSIALLSHDFSRLTDPNSI